MKDLQTITRSILNLICFGCLFSSLVLFGINLYRVSIHGERKSISSDPADPSYMEPVAKEQFLASQEILWFSASLLMCVSLMIRVFQEILKKFGMG